MEDVLLRRYIDTALLTHREETALRAAQRNRMSIGVGVTREAQEIFDKLKQTMPCAALSADTQRRRVKIRKLRSRVF